MTVAKNTPAAALVAARKALADAEAAYRATLPEGPAVDDVPTVPATFGTAVPFGPFCEELLALYGPTMRSAATRRSMVHAIGILKTAGVTMTSDLNVALVGRVIASRDPAASPNTVRSLLRRFMVIANHAVGLGVLPRGSPFAVRPLRSWVRPRHVSGTDRHLSRAQVKALLELLNADIAARVGYPAWRARRLAALVTLIAYTGLRKGEALTLQIADVDLAAGFISVVDRQEHRTKTFGSAQKVPIAPDLEAPLRDWMEHRLDAHSPLTREGNVWLFPNTMVNSPWLHGACGAKPLDRLRAAGERAGIDPPPTFQRLRRTVATMLMAHTNQPMVTRILRHGSSEVTRMFYMCEDETNLRDAVREFRY